MVGTVVPLLFTCAHKKDGQKIKNFGYTYLDLSAQLRRSQGAMPPQGIFLNIAKYWDVCHLFSVAIQFG